MLNPRLRHLPFLNKPSNGKSRDGTSFKSAADYAAAQSIVSNRLRDNYGADWIIDVPLLNPMKIMEEVAISPISAAVRCQHACSLLGKGHHRRVAEYIASAYTIACGLRDNDRHIRLLSLDVIDGRTKKPLSMEQVKDKLLHYLFIYIFFQSKMTTRDRATQYAQGLQPYFDSKVPPAEVAQRLYEHGPDRLRRAVQLRAKRLQDARAWAESGHPALIPMDEAVAEVAAEDAAKDPTSPEDEPTDYGPRELPPDTEASGESDTGDDIGDYDLLAEDNDDPEARQDGDEADDEDDDGEEEADDEGDDDDELTQPPVVDEFFSATMHLTAQLVVGLHDEEMTAEKRAALTGLVVRLATKITTFRGLLA